jgi:hypothetical protein
MPYRGLDTQSFTWVFHNATAGDHFVAIIASGINFGSGSGVVEEIVITNRTLVVFAARTKPSKGAKSP